MNFIENAQEPTIKLKPSLSMKEVSVKSGDLELTVTNFIQRSPEGTMTDEITIRMWRDDKEIEFDLPDDFLNDLKNRVRLTEYEKKMFEETLFLTFVDLLLIDK